MTNKVNIDGCISINRRGALVISIPAEYKGRYLFEKYYDGVRLVPTTHQHKGVNTWTNDNTKTREYIQAGKKTCIELGINAKNPMRSTPYKMWVNAITGVIYVPSVKRFFEIYAGKFNTLSTQEEVEAECVEAESIKYQNEIETNPATISNNTSPPAYCNFSRATAKACIEQLNGYSGLKLFVTDAGVLKATIITEHPL